MKNFLIFMLGLSCSSIQAAGFDNVDSFISFVNTLIEDVKEGNMVEFLLNNDVIFWAQDYSGLSPT